MYTKYILYFIYKFFKLFISLLIFTFFSGLSNAQFNDTLSLKYKNSQLLFISKSDEVDEWSFEEDTDKSHQKINAFKICLSIGKLLLNNSYQLNGAKNFEYLPYNQCNSSTINIKVYLKSYKLNSDNLKMSWGVGLEKIKLNLGNNLINIIDDSLEFNIANSKNIIRNNLNHHYFTLPINISWIPFPNKNPYLNTQFEIVNQILWYGKANFRYLENNVDYFTIINNTFFNTRYYLSANLKIIYKKIGAYFQSSISPYSNLYPTMSNYSYGLTLCL